MHKRAYGAIVQRGHTAALMVRIRGCDTIKWLAATPNTLTARHHAQREARQCCALPPWSEYLHVQTRLQV